MAAPDAESSPLKDDGPDETMAVHPVDETEAINAWSDATTTAVSKQTKMRMTPHGPRRSRSSGREVRP
jgi:hypothetical protein